MNNENINCAEYSHEVHAFHAADSRMTTSGRTAVHTPSKFDSLSQEQTKNFFFFDKYMPENAPDRAEQKWRLWPQRRSPKNAWLNI